MVNTRAPGDEEPGAGRDPDRAATAGDAPPRRTQAERRQATRQALIEAALLRLESGESFDSLSLRSLARAAGVVPTAFYRHFASLDELGLALVDESFRTLRGMLRGAREGGAPPEVVIRNTVRTLIGFVRQHRQHFAFIARARSTGNPLLRHAIRAEIRLLTSELATDLTRFPYLKEWTTEDLQMVAALLVNSMISIVEAILDVPADDPAAHDEIAVVAEKQLRLVILGIPAWRSRGSRPDPPR